MADNYLEKKYRDLFGDHTVVNPETGFAEQKNSGLKIPKPVKKKNPSPTLNHKSNY